MISLAFRTAEDLELIARLLLSKQRKVHFDRNELDRIDKIIGKTRRNKR